MMILCYSVTEYTHLLTISSRYCVSALLVEIIAFKIKTRNFQMKTQKVFQENLNGPRPRLLWNVTKL